MKFCMVSTFYPPYHFGGDATYVYRLSNELARHGHLVDVIHDRDAYHIAHPAEPTAVFENHPNVTVYALKSRLGGLSPLMTQQTGHPFFKNQIKTLLETNHYDVIHYHNISLIGPGALGYGKAPKLMTLHEHWLLCPMHVLWKLNRELCDKPECFRCMVQGGRPPQLWRYTKFLHHKLAHVDQFISPSRFTRDRHLERGLNIPITVLPYFLPRVDAPTSNTPAPTRPYFLFAGRLVKIKGLQTLIPIFKNYPHADLWVAGEGDYGDELRTLARDVPNIKFLGALSQAQLQILYQNAIAVIMPSICYEVFGIVLIEAFARKTPVIVRDLGGMPEAVQDSDGGIIFRSDAELVQAMTRLQQNPALRRTLGENGYAAYVKHWNEKPHLDKYFEIIEGVAERKGRTLPLRVPSSAEPEMTMRRDDLAGWELQPAQEGV
ncbi:MAG TPA: glycosyltransferase family 4 protein [Anaerolineae bacterium]|nr:glycosyltransferase family 4 protein [Anaerolineae bacterium]